MATLSVPYAGNTYIERVIEGGAIYESEFSWHFFGALPVPSSEPDYVPVASQPSPCTRAYVMSQLPYTTTGNTSGYVACVGYVPPPVKLPPVVVAPEPGSFFMILCAAAAAGFRWGSLCRA